MKRITITLLACLTLSAGACQPPKAVTGLVASRPQAQVIAVALTWKDTKTETGYRVERVDAAGNRVVLATLPQGTTQFMDITALWGVTYTWFVVPTNRCGDGQASSVTFTY